MQTRNRAKIREKRIEQIRELLIEGSKVGKDYFIQDLANITKIPRGSVDRYLNSYFKDEIEFYVEGRIKKIKYLK